MTPIALAFIGGAIVGFLIGVLTMSLLSMTRDPEPAEQPKAEAVVDPETAGRDAYKTLEERMTQAHDIGDADALKAAIQDAERSTELTETERDDLTNLGADLWMDMEASS